MIELQRRMVKGALAQTVVEGASFIPLVEGSPLQGRQAWKVIPDWLKGTSYSLAKDGSNGVAIFRVETDGLVLMAVSSRWGGGGNRSGGWYEECKSKQDLLKDNWQEVAATLPSTMGDWLLFVRNCRKGESFKIRTEKYMAPTILWRPMGGQATTKSADLRPESQEWFGAVLGIYGQWGKLVAHPYVNVTVPNKNLWTEAIKAKLRGKIDFAEIQYTGTTTLLIRHDGIYQIKGSGVELSIDGKKIDPGDIELRKGVYKFQIHSNTHGQPFLPNAAASVIDKSTDKPVPFVVTGSELKEFLSRTVNGKKVIEVSGENPLRIR